MKLLNAEKVASVLDDMKIITAESAFVVRTFFFIIFGWSVYLGSLLNFKVVGIGLVILAVIYIVRALVLFIFNGKDILLPLFLAPRGLVTILLFFAIPEELSVGASFQGAFGAFSTFFMIWLGPLSKTVPTAADSHSRFHVHQWSSNEVEVRNWRNI